MSSERVLHDPEAQTGASSFAFFDAFRASREDLIPVIMAEETVQEKPVLGSSLLAKLEARRKGMNTAPAQKAEETVVAGDVLDEVSAPKSPVKQEPAKVSQELKEGLSGEFLGFGADSNSAKGSNKRKRDDAVNDGSDLPPWCEERFEKFGGYCFSNEAIALHQEVTDFIEYLRPSEAEITMRRLVELEIADIAKEHWPDCEPVVYGSMSTHLLLPSSDIDMSILNVPDDTETALNKLGRSISRRRLCTSTYPQVILGAKVPLVKFTHHLAKVEVDVSINAGDGKHNSDIVKGYLQEYPEAPPLIMIVKHILQQRGLNEPYKGGMGSFATTLFVCSFLQHHPIYTTDVDSRQYYGLGRLLVDLFRYYGQLFNFHRVGVSLERGGEYFVKPPSGNDPITGRPAAAVVVEDPGMATNNAASSLRHYQSVATGFSWCYTALTAVAPINPDAGYHTKEVFKRPTILARVINPDDELQKRRDLMEAAYIDWVEEADDAYVNRVRAYKRVEDAPMIKGAKPMHAKPTMSPTEKNPSSTKKDAKAGSTKKSKPTSPVSEGLPKKRFAAEEQQKRQQQQRSEGKPVSKGTVKQHARLRGRYAMPDSDSDSGSERY